MWQSTRRFACAAIVLNAGIFVAFPQTNAQQLPATAPSQAADEELTAWQKAVSENSPNAFIAFKANHPNSKYISVLRADVNPGYRMTLTMNSGGSGVAEGGPIHIDVVGHPALSGDYSISYANSLGAVGVKLHDNGTMDVLPVKNVELFIAQLNGAPRIVAARQ